MRGVALGQLFLGLGEHLFDDVVQLLPRPVQRHRQFLQLAQSRAVLPQMVNLAGHPPQVLVFGCGGESIELANEFRGHRGRVIYLCLVSNLMLLFPGSCG